MKENIPRAGPKYRLGMYFDTIHNLEKFDDISEDGYTSYWETDTEVDEELGNFLFDNVAGDSASVICIDEAMDLIAMREQQNQRESPIQVDHYTLPHNPRHFSSEIHMMERSNENKRSTAFRNSRRSHNSGSDGAYDEPPPVPPPRRQISSPPVLSPEEHTYETLDDCQEEYAIYIAKGSDGSRGSGGSADSTAKPVECDDRFKATNGSSKSPVQGFSKPRSMSTPQPLEGIHIRHRRKLSEPVSTEYSSSRKRRSEKVGPKSSFPPPVRGYQLPPGIPRTILSTQQYLQQLLPTDDHRTTTHQCHRQDEGCHPTDWRGSKTENQPAENQDRHLRYSSDTRARHTLFLCWTRSFSRSSRR